MTSFDFAQAMHDRELANPPEPRPEPPNPEYVWRVPIYIEVFVTAPNAEGACDKAKDVNKLDRNFIEVCEIGTPEIESEV